MGLLVGVDPGGNFTGAAVHNGEGFVFWLESDDPCVIWDLIRTCKTKPTVIVEDFLGNGQLNKARKQTIEVLGFIYNVCRANAVPVIRQVPNARLAYVIDVPQDIYIHKDARSAAAHVLAYMAGRDRAVHDHERLRVQRKPPATRSARRSPVRKTPRP